ncbi:MAG: YjjG family noncanonical pyrimidine nucleotidase [Candidatus Cloacimonetes bacterium]|nr:YjjG family noncanonical pyrimidine nucleotidase [Candidatus Cloacimonadota bacterium]
MKYSLLLFDIDNTIFDFFKASRTALRLTCNNLEITYTKDYYDNYWIPVNHDVWELYEQNKIDSDTLRHERFRQFFELIGAEANQHRASEIYNEYLSEKVYLIEHAEIVLEQLSSHCTMVAVTNGMAEIQHRRLEKSGLRKYFKTIIISDEVGVAKPHPEIFRFAMQVGEESDKSRVLMIGDNPIADIKGATDFGLDTCLYKYSGDEREVITKPTFTINCLTKLPGIIKNS